MKNCSKCKRMMYNVGNFEEKLFTCSLNYSKQFNHPKLHGWCCKHYVNKIIGRSKDVRED